MISCIHVHRIQRMRADASDVCDTSWLEIEDDEGNSITLFIPIEKARAIEAAWTGKDLSTATSTAAE
jgi:hypothetical protein